MTKDQSFYYDHITGQNKQNIVDLLSKLYPDQYFPALNEDAISYIAQFQKSNGLEVDGIAGAMTVSKMRSALGMIPVKKATPINLPTQQQTEPQPKEPEKKRNKRSCQSQGNFFEKNKYAVIFMMVVLLWAKKR